MRSNIRITATVALAIFGLSGAATGVPAQEEQEELEEIPVPSRYEDQPEAAAEEDFEDLVFDEETGSYRLVVDDEGDDWVEGPSEREVAAEELMRMFDLYKEALNNAQFLEADTLAKRIVEMSIRLNGLDSFDSAKAVSNLSRVAAMRAACRWKKVAHWRFPSQLPPGAAFSRGEGVIMAGPN